MSPKMFEDVVWFISFFLNRRYSVNVTYKTKLVTHQAALMKYYVPDADKDGGKRFSLQLMRLTLNKDVLTQNLFSCFNR